MLTLQQVRSLIKECTSIQEGNPLARFHSLRQKGHTTFTVTSNRGERSPEENAKHMHRTKRYLRRKGVGFRDAEGKWNEGDGVAKEPSLHVISKTPDKQGERRTERVVKRIAKKEKQDSYIKITPDGKGTAHFTRDTKYGAKKGDKVEYGSLKYNKDNPDGETRYKGRSDKFTLTK